MFGFLKKILSPGAAGGLPPAGRLAVAAALLTKLCTHDGSLPQGAPTSPRLSNLVNHRLDARLFALARKRNVAYSRYADDITISGASDEKHRPTALIHVIKKILKEE